MGDILAALDVSVFLQSLQSFAPSAIMLAAVGWLLHMVVNSIDEDPATRRDLDEDDDADEED